MSESEKKELTVELAMLEAKREMLFSRIQELFDISQKLDESSESEFLSRLSELGDDIPRVEELTDRINVLTMKLNPKRSPNYEMVKTVTILKREILKVERRIKGDASALVPASPRSAPTTVGFHLPEISLPEFSGEVTEWPLFFEKFRTIIHNNAALEPATKLHYLLSCLKGKAREVCGGITPGPHNYEVILGLLRSRFDSKRALADSHYDQMSEARPLTPGSVPLLSRLLVKFEAGYNSLMELLPPAELVDYFIISMLLRKLDPETRLAFEKSTHSEIPTYKELSSFLGRHLEAMSQVPQVRPPTIPRLPFHKSETNVKRSFLTRVKAEASCSCCGGTHQLFKCDKFHSLTPGERLTFVSEKELCQNCLSSQHKLSACKSQHSCKHCHERHHSLLHVSETTKHKSQTFCAFSNTQSTLLLSTVVVKINTSQGTKKVRFLLDSASQANFITSDCCQRLKLKFQTFNTKISGIGSITSGTKGSLSIRLTTKDDPGKTFEINALVVEKISDPLPSSFVDIQELGYLTGLPLADESFHEPGVIDGILGAEVFGRVLGSNKISGPPNFPVAIETAFGFVIMGSAPVVSSGLSTAIPSSVYMALTNEDLNSALNRFWELEEVSNIVPTKDEDDQCEQLFKRTTTRDSDGRYIVRLPFKEFPPILGDSRQVALRRLLSLERRFKKAPKFFDQYSKVIQDYLSQGHLEKVPLSDREGQQSVFIPHFAVLKESSSTPLRIVFDASVRTMNGRSLNDSLFTGPKLQKDIAQILLNFRLAPIALTADIRQMYRNIAVAPEHRRFQRILWRNSPSEQPEEYELTSVVFGLTSAPYLALRTVQQLTEDECHRFPLAAQLVQNGMYVDDLVISVETPQKAITAFHQLMQLFTAGGFRLTKWSTNSPELEEIIPSDDRLQAPITFSEKSNPLDIIKVLGLRWSAVTDKFSFHINFPQPNFTKRGILSTIARIWDPLGFLAPTVLFAKCLVKELWIQGIDWDDQIPSSTHQKWKTFFEELPCLSNLQIPRYFGVQNSTTLSLVGFCDSSEKGFGAVIYAVVRESTTTTHVSILCAKSRVTPLKNCSLPRLELCAALLLGKMMNASVTNLQCRLPLESIFAFSDSTVALHWISQPPHRWKTFVANRVAKIQAWIPKEKWFHVSSGDNVADCISRGLSPAQLVQFPAWIQGPEWLRRPSGEWPITRISIDTSTTDIPELKMFMAITTTKTVDDEIETLLERFSSWRKLLRVTSFLLRFGKRSSKRGPIEVAELDASEKVLVRQIQLRHFSKELEALSKNLGHTSKFSALSPFLEENLIRVGGRLGNSSLSYNAKHPLLIPKQSRAAILLIDDAHRQTFHSGCNLVLSMLRQKFWIPGARSLVRTRVKKCNFCFRRQPQAIFPLMADLPACRVQPSKPFDHTGVDYAGPFLITISRRRGASSLKTYICVFICMTTKAVHLELASGLSTEAFLNCFKRFLGRRGPVSHIYSDRGTNFVGAKAELSDLENLTRSGAYNEIITRFLGDSKIVWKLNPPHAPHFGGLWERNIRGVKNHLARAIGRQLLSFEEFYTILVQVEALMNSRPLTSLSSDPGEPEALTPAHFLNFSPLRSLPLSDLDQGAPLRTRKALLDSILRAFWKRWHLEYLSSLQSRNKWRVPVDSLKVGTVVVIKTDNVPPLCWPLGVIHDVHPGPDGNVRVVTVLSGGKLLQRPVVKICPLPTQ